MLVLQKRFRIFLYILLTIAYAFIIAGFMILLRMEFNLHTPLEILLVVFFIALTLPIFQSFFSLRIDQMLAARVQNYDQHVKDFSESLVKASSIAEILQTQRSIIEVVFKPSVILFYLLDNRSGEYCQYDETAQEFGSGVRFLPESLLVDQLLSGDILDVAREASSHTLSEDQVRINLLASQIILPLKSAGQLAGWLAIGEPGVKRDYDQKEKQFLKRICDLAAIAIQRAQAQLVVENQDQDLMILTRIAQGISFTTSFDDILELITTQTNQVIHADDFKITLHQASTGNHYHVLVSQKNERLTEQENVPLSENSGLEIHVIRTQRPIIANDYEKECYEREFTVASQGIFAWMGVPLNAGAETIGAISMASRQPKIYFNEDQRDLLQAIADLTAGAIVNARLLAESQHRVSQLAQLNEISLELTSTLDLSALFSKILENAIQILQCAAGYLVMVDNHAGELSIEAAHGVDPPSMVGRKLPLGTGIVGQTILGGSVMITQADLKNGELEEDALLLQDIELEQVLAVPMRIQDRVIGAIEVINKLDGTQFNQADQEWLTAFTNQATVAIENTRLYTMTDRALADRVDELFVMQQIDRQLNASLEVESALQITLDWAIKQSHAEAGLVGVLDEQEIHLLSTKGYPSELFGKNFSQNENPENLFQNIPIIQAAVRLGKSQIFDASENSSQAGNGLLDGMLSQAAIPIRREADIIGILFLESLKHQTFGDEILLFLSRLSDHAAIALANAKLFEEVQEANISKSRFVSFVAHELKNPMASIKGYTELVASGMAGPVTEMQASFLATVRSNVDRMNTIVSDLNDLTKIQVGNLALNCSEISLSEIFTEVLRSLQRQIDEKKQLFTWHLPNDVPSVWADPSRLSQILMNLISNATKYTLEGGTIFIGAELMPLDVENSERVHIWVQDHGIGIPNEDQKKIFQQYFRTDAAKEMASGTGLGLNITRSLVELQGGEIWFESEPGEGTTFHFTLPVYHPEVLILKDSEKSN